MATTSDTLNPNIWGFSIEFAAWLQEAHPEVTGALYILEDDGSPVYPDATFMETALQFVEEFVASRQ